MQLKSIPLSLLLRPPREGRQPEGLRPCSFPIRIDRLTRSAAQKLVQRQAVKSFSHSVAFLLSIVLPIVLFILHSGDVVKHTYKPMRTLLISSSYAFPFYIPMHTEFDSSYIPQSVCLDGLSLPTPPRSSSPPHWLPNLAIRISANLINPHLLVPLCSILKASSPRIVMLIAKHGETVNRLIVYRYLTIPLLIIRFFHNLLFWFLWSTKKKNQSLLYLLLWSADCSFQNVQYFLYSLKKSPPLVQWTSDSSWRATYSGG